MPRGTNIQYFAGGNLDPTALPRPYTAPRPGSVSGTETTFPRSRIVSVCAYCCHPAGEGEPIVQHAKLMVRH